MPYFKEMSVVLVDCTALIDFQMITNHSVYLFTHSTSLLLLDSQCLFIYVFFIE